MCVFEGLDDVMSETLVKATRICISIAIILFWSAICIQLGMWNERRAAQKKLDVAIEQMQARAAAKGHPIGRDLAEWFVFHPVMANIAEAESEFNPKARGRSGERGMFQVIPRYWGKVPTDPLAQAKQAEKILNSLIREHKSFWKAVERYNGSGPQARAYVKRQKEMYYG